MSEKIDIVVTVAGCVESLSEILERAPQTKIVIWPTYTPYFERCASGEEFYSVVQVLEKDLVSDLKPLFLDLGLFPETKIEENLLKIWRSPKFVVGIFENHGFGITKDELSSAVINNTDR